MDDFNAKLKSKRNGIHANKLPAEIVGRFLQNLSVVDRLKSECVSPQWKRAFSEWGWTKQQKLSREIVFEGASGENVARFCQPPIWGPGCCHLLSLLPLTGPWIRELDLHSFVNGNIVQFTPQIAASLETLTALEKLDIGELDLGDFLDHLPPTLREFKTFVPWIVATLKALSNRCPNLEEIRVVFLENNYEGIELIGKFPRLKRLKLSIQSLVPNDQGALASIGQLRELEELDISSCYGPDGKSLEAIVEGCQRLRSLSLNTRCLTEEELFPSAKLPNLTTLRAFNSSVSEKGKNFTDSVLKAIAKRGQLKILWIVGTEVLTDDSIVYLIDQCKSLASLHLSLCPKITERSLKAVIAEVQRRHRWPPRTLPIGPRDEGIFYINAIFTAIDEERAREMIIADENPWLIFGNNPHEINDF